MNLKARFLWEKKKNLKARFLWEKKKNIVISKMSWCNVLRKTGSDFLQLIITRHLRPFLFHDIHQRTSLRVCWFMPVKSWVVRCLSNAVVNVPRNCWKRTLNIADIKQFSKWHFRNNYGSSSTKDVRAYGGWEVEN